MNHRTALLLFMPIFIALLSCKREFESYSLLYSKDKRLDSVITSFIEKVVPKDRKSMIVLRFYENHEQIGCYLSFIVSPNEYDYVNPISYYFVNGKCVILCVQGLSGFQLKDEEELKDKYLGPRENVIVNHCPPHWFLLKKDDGFEKIYPE